MNTTTTSSSTNTPATIKTIPSKRLLEAGPGQDGEDDEDMEIKRRRVLEETRDIDADSDGSHSDSSDEDRYVEAMDI